MLKGVGGSSDGKGAGLTAPAKDGHASVLALADKVNSFRLNGREVYWHARDRVSFLKISGATMVLIKFKKMLLSTRSFSA